MFPNGTVCDKNVDVKDVLRVKRLAKGKDTGEYGDFEKRETSRKSQCRL